MTKVAVAIIEKEGRILIARRIKNDPLKYRWEFPGGKVEEGETAEECVKREVFEELGIDIMVKERICASPYDYAHMSIELLAYKASHVSGELKRHEYQRVQWVMPSELDSYDFPEANRPLINRLMNERL
jgi:8-oxo-dGTP diphosphatase